MTCFPQVDPRPDIRVSNPIAEYWPSPVVFPDDTDEYKRRHEKNRPETPKETTWHKRPRTTTGPWQGPWNDELDVFLDYLTGTPEAPTVSLLMDTPVEAAWDEYGDTIAPIDMGDSPDDEQLESVFPQSHGWSVTTGDRGEVRGDDTEWRPEYDELLDGVPADLVDDVAA